MLANIHRSEDSHPEPYTAANFMPGAKTEEDDMREFIDRIQAGETFEAPPEQIAAFRASLERNFEGIDSGAVTNVGPTGRPEKFATNAIAGEAPRRGVQ